MGIVLDQSSSNMVSENYIEDTYFSAIGVVAPKQFIFINHVAGTFEGTAWLGRDFHSREFNPSSHNTIPETPVEDFDQGTWDAMSNLYSGNNVIENNAFVNTNSGQGYLVQSVIYISGLTRSQTTFVRNNYFFETTEATTNSSIIWADSDQDNTDWIGNMVFGIDVNDNEPEPLPVYRANAHCLGVEDAVLHDDGDRALIKANVTLDSMFPEHTGFDIDDFRQLEGNQTLASGGDPSHASFYEASWSAICPGIVAGQVLPGASSFQSSLAIIIANSNGTVPTCAPFGAPNLVVTKTDGVVTVDPGDDLIYVLEVENINGSDAENVVVTETVPEGTTFNAALSNAAWNCSGTTAGSGCTAAVGTVATGGPAVGLAFTVTVASPTVVATVVNTTTVADDGANGADENPADNTATTMTPVNVPCNGSTELVLTNPLGAPMVVYEACNSITAGTNFFILTGRDVEFRARNLIVLEDGFGVDDGAAFGAILDPLAGQD